MLSHTPASSEQVSTTEGILAENPLKIEPHIKEFTTDREEFGDFYAGGVDIPDFEGRIGLGGFHELVVTLLIVVTAGCFEGSGRLANYPTFGGGSRRALQDPLVLQGLHQHQDSNSSPVS